MGLWTMAKNAPTSFRQLDQSELPSLDFAYFKGNVMTDQQLALEAVSEAQRILGEYLQPKPHKNHEAILDRLVEVLDRSDVVAAVSRLQRSERPVGDIALRPN